MSNNIIIKIRKAFKYNVVISSSGESFLIEDIELVNKGIAVRSICYGCLFNEVNYTCKYIERMKMPISCLDVENSNYQIKTK